jgi:hypothetical protein
MSAGTAAEVMTRHAVAAWGLPDFVFRPKVAQKGVGQRELGDGLIIIGRQAVVIQVKRRNSPGNDSSRERSWISKRVVQAARQADGTLRYLKQFPPPHAFTNERGRTLDIDARLLDWLALVIIDHPRPPDGISLPVSTGRMPLVVMLRRDWEFLLHQLRSTSSVVRYLNWCTQKSPVALGEEPSRYGTIAIDSETRQRAPLEMSLVREGKTALVPLFPAKPLNRDELPGHTAVREILEAVATMRLPDFLEEADRHELLSLIDEFPVQCRGYLGEWILKAFLDVLGASRSGTFAFRLKTFRFSDYIPQYVFGVSDDTLDDATQLAFHDLVQLRHQELRGQYADPDSVDTFGFVIAPDEKRLSSSVIQWPWSIMQFVRVRGPITLTRQELTYVREFWSLK